MKNRWKMIVAIVLPIAMAVVTILISLMNNNQAMMTVPFKLEMQGEYSYDEETWYSLEDIDNMSARYPHVTIRGNFNMDIGEGGRINYYRNHIGVSIYKDGECIFMDAQTEVHEYELNEMASMCGKDWTCFLLQEDGLTTKDMIEIRLINPHKYGNEAAYREFFKTMCISGNENEIIEGSLEPYIKPFRMIGSALMIIAALVLGASIASFLYKGNITYRLILLGCISFCGGGYILCDAMFVFSLDEILALKTYGRQICMMLGIYFLELLLADILKGRKKLWARRIVYISGAWNVLLLLVAMFGVRRLFDLQLHWIVSQMIVGSILLYLCVRSLINRESEDRLILYSAMALIATMLIDFWTKDLFMFCPNMATKIVFIVIVIISLIRGLRYFVISQHAVVRAKRLESELTNMRVETLISQIQPHFIYNTLGTIGQFCLEDAQKAADLVQEFSLYLRGNFTELDNSKPIRLSKEIEHVKHYVSIETIRFPDMQVVYDILTDDFLIPALTVQPLVENAIKHGLMGLESGGTVCISSYETEKSYVVQVKDDGVGFEEDAVFADGKKHVGICNIRGRIEGMCKGSLYIESKPGEGTVARIEIPKGRRK